MTVVLEFDSSLEMEEIAEGLRSQFKMKKINKLSDHLIEAFAALCNAFIEENAASEISVYDYILDNGPQSKKSYCMLLAASYCYLPHEVNGILLYKMGIKNG